MNQFNKIVAKSVTLHDVSATTVGLGNVDNTSDVNKPVSVATQTALDLKLDSSSLTTHSGDTANPHAVTATQVGLGNVDNTADTDKPISTLAQAALDLKVDDSTDQLTVDDTSSNSGIIMKALADSPSFTDDIAAFTAGVELGELYRTYNVVKIRLPLATFLRTDGLSRFLRPDGISSFVRG
jgi:hypothetical protein